MIDMIKDLKSSWSKLDAEIKELAQEINQARVRMQEASLSSQRHLPAPADEDARGFQRGCTMSSSNRRIKPDWDTVCS